MKHSALPIKHIVAPMLVMVMLITITGFSAFELTKSWEEASRNVNRQMTEAVLLNNIHWHLVQLKLHQSDPARVQSHWNTIQQQVDGLKAISVERRTVDTLHMLQLQLFKQDRLNLALLDRMIEQDFFDRQLDKARTELTALKNHTQLIIFLITLAMSALGLVLLLLTAWDLNRMFGALKASRDLNILVQEDERRRIAQDLHDGVVQELVDLKRQYTPDKVERIIDTLRRVCHNLKPQVLDDLGLVAALDGLVDDLRKGGVAQVRLTVDEARFQKLPKRYELPLFRIVQELCSNIKHHARASQVIITLVYEPDESSYLSGYIKDNGQGFDPAVVWARQPDRMGLRGVRDRIEQLDGRLSIQSRPGEGSLIEFAIPIRQDKPAKSGLLFFPAFDSNKLKEPTDDVTSLSS